MRTALSLLLAFALIFMPHASAEIKLNMANTEPLNLAHAGTYEESPYYPGDNSPSWYDVIDQGADLIEMNLRETKDHYATFLHDATLNRLTPYKGTVASRTRKQMNAGHLDGGEKIAVDTDLLKLLANTDITAVVELKVNPSTTLWKRLKAQLAPYKSRVIFYSGVDNAWAKRAHFSYGFTVARYTAGGTKVPSVSTIKDWTGAKYHYGAAVRFSEAQRAAMRSAGIKLIGWGQNDAQFEAEAEAGAWAVSTYYADDYTDWSTNG